MLEIWFLFSIDSLGADSFHSTWHVHCIKFISMFFYKWFFFSWHNLILMQAYKNDEETKITDTRTKSIHLTGEIVHEMNKMIACQILRILHLLRFYYIPQFPANHGYYLHQPEKSDFPCHAITFTQQIIYCFPSTCTWKYQRTLYFFLKKHTNNFNIYV